MNMPVEIIGTPKSGKTTFIKKIFDRPPFESHLSFKQFVISRKSLQYHKFLIIMFSISNDDICHIIKFLKDMMNINIRHKTMINNTMYQSKILLLGNKRDLHESKEYRSCYSELIGLVKQLKGTYMAVSLKSNYNWLSVKKETNTLSLLVNKR